MEFFIKKYRAYLVDHGSDNRILINFYEKIAFLFENTQIYFYILLLLARQVSSRQL
jgi:hypothetical protein